MPQPRGAGARAPRQPCPAHPELLPSLWLRRAAECCPQFLSPRRRAAAPWVHTGLCCCRCASEQRKWPGLSPYSAAAVPVSTEMPQDVSPRTATGSCGSSSFSRAPPRSSPSRQLRGRELFPSRSVGSRMGMGRSCTQHSSRGALTRGLL